MIETFDQFTDQATPTLAIFEEWVSKAKPNATADHICFTCVTSEEFETMRGMLERNSTFVYQSIISERRIAIIKFQKPFTTTLGDIWHLELSDQKKDQSQKSGFDHIEIFPKNGTGAELATALLPTTQFVEKIRPHHTTYDATIEDGFKVKIEDGPLVEKIITQEM